MAIFINKPFFSMCQETAGVLSRLLILLSLIVHLFHTWVWSDYDLAQDEAHYWDWSRHLDWSYYSKGPLIAWIIALANYSLSGLSEHWTGSLTAAIRTPAAFFGSLLLWFLCLLTEQIFHSRKLGFVVVIAALTIPPIAVVSTIITIDSPFTCLWAAALLCAWWAINRRKKWIWALLGVVVGLGILAKYTMAIFYPSLGLFLLINPANRKQWIRPGLWISGGVAILVASPILVWNWQHGGVTFAHVGQLAGVTHDNTKHWIGPLRYVGEQLGLLLGYWFVLWVWAMIAYRPGKSQCIGMSYLWWMSAPMFLVFLGFSFRTGGGEVNWPAASYLAGLPLIGFFLSRQLESPSEKWRKWVLSFLVCFLAIGFGLAFVVHKTDILYPVLSRLVPEPTVGSPVPLRQLDPVCRVRGWKFLSAEVDRMREEISASGKEPILVATHWSIPGLLGVYCKGHPQAYSIGLAVGDRHSQYDLWTNPIDQPAQFLGRDFIVVGGIPKQLHGSFDSIQEANEIIYHTPNGYPVANFWIQVGKGFKGIPKDVGEKKSW